MEALREFFKSQRFSRIVCIVMVILFLYFFRSMLDMFLLAFIFIFCSARVEHFLLNKFPHAPHNVLKLVQILIFLISSAGLIYYIVYNIPYIYTQISHIFAQTQDFLLAPSNNEVERYIKEAANQIYVAAISEQGMKYLTGMASNVGKIGLQVVLSLVISIFFILGKESVTEFFGGFKNSHVTRYAIEVEYLGNKFLSSFGKVIEVQILIALINGGLSSIFLTVMGFPSVLAFAVMITFLGLIPVMGVFISLFPLCVVGYNTGGLKMVVYVLIMIVLLHGFESYYLNPKIMSKKTELPVFVTFVVLIVAEHVFGVWGLIIGIPLFVFIIDMLGVSHSAKND